MISSAIDRFLESGSCRNPPLTRIVDQHREPARYSAIGGALASDRRLITPLLVATTHRPPRREVDSTRPRPRTTSPRETIPLGPANIAAPYDVSELLTGAEEGRAATSAINPKLNCIVQGLSRKFLVLRAEGALSHAERLR